LEAASSDFKNWFLMNKVRSCKFYGFAFPGDQVELEVQPCSGSAGAKSYKGLAAVKGKKKVVVEFEGELVPFEQLEDLDEQKRFFQILLRT